MKPITNYLNYKSITFSLLVLVSILVQSCSDEIPEMEEEDPIEEINPCDENLDSYIIINNEKFILDLDDPELIFKCEFDSSLNLFIVALDELIQTVGGIEINDVLGIGFSMNELRPGNYKLVRFEEVFCSTGEIELMTDDAFSSIQTSNCCEFYSEESSVQVFECDNSLYIKTDSIVYSEFVCDVNQGGSFIASLQLKCY